MKTIDPQVKASFSNYADSLREALLAAENSLDRDDIDTACTLMGGVTQSVARRTVDLDNFRIKMKGPSGD